MHLSRILFSSIVILSFFLSGCGSQDVKDTWKGARSYYYEYLNTPVAIDYSDKGSADSCELLLGEAIADFDMQLRDLQRSMENSDRSPDNEWVEQMFRRFPWLSGVALVDATGQVMAQAPGGYIKDFVIEPLLAEPEKVSITSLRAYVQESSYGPEIYLSKPVYKGSEFRGLVVVHFDPKALLVFVKDPGCFMLATQDMVLWSGRFKASATPVIDADWAKLAASRASGFVRNESGRFYWVSRYLGNLVLIYTIPEQGAAFLENSDSSAGTDSDASFDDYTGSSGSGYRGLEGASPYGGGYGMGGYAVGSDSGEVGNIGSPDVSPTDDTPKPAVEREEL